MRREAAWWRGEWQGKGGENKKWSGGGGGGVREGMRRAVLVTQKAVSAVQSMMTV